MRWLNLSLPIVLLLAACALLGWWFGYALEFAFAAVCMSLLYGCFQLWQLRQWMDNPAQLWPGPAGVWGEIAQGISRQRSDALAAQSEQQAETEYLLKAMSSLPDAIVIVESRGAVRWSNAAAESLLGVHFPRHAGQSLTSLVTHPEFVDYVAAQHRDAPLLFNPMPELFLQVVITQFGEGDSLLFARDVTRRANMEQVRRDFVGNVSHELRTPLTVISGYLATFLAEPSNLPPVMKKPLQQMSQQAGRMESLLSDLLWLSRIESDEREGKRESVDVAELLRELNDELIAAYPERRLIMRISTDVKVSGDYRELYSAASNLVQNAFKYSARDTPVTVSLRVGIGGYHLSVSDLGPGIEQSHIPRLTERFYRVDDSRSSATGGTGLGLAIVKHVAASHGAQLLIKSEVGRGSTFALVFPYQYEQGSHSPNDPPA